MTNTVTEEQIAAKQLLSDLMGMRKLSNSDAKWSIDSESHDSGRWTTYRDLITQDITHIAESNYEVEQALANVAAECTSAHGDGGSQRIRYIVALHNALPAIAKALTESTQ